MLEVEIDDAGRGKTVSKSSLEMVWQGGSLGGCMARVPDSAPTSESRWNVKTVVVDGGYMRDSQERWRWVYRE